MDIKVIKESSGFIPLLNLKIGESINRRVSGIEALCACFCI